MENIQKIVNFDEYCKRCKYRKVDETKDPCNECLTYGANLYSSRPVNFEEGGTKHGRRKEGE